MVLKARAGARIKECEAEFEIANFRAVCAMTKTVSDGKEHCREIVSGPILIAEQHKFGIAVVWCLKGNGGIDLEKHLGVYAKRLDDVRGECRISVQMTVVNQQASKSCILCDEEYTDIRSGNGRGWSPSFNRTTGEPHKGIENLPLAEVFDVARGWLHAGALRVTCKVFVAVGMDEPHSIVPDPCGQLEVCDSLRTLLASKHLADVSIRVGSERLEAHALILSARSPVFAGMFACPMKESSEREVCLQDLEPAAVRGLVSYLYAGDVDQGVLESDDSALALLRAAHRFEVPGLVQRCVQALASRFDVDTVSERLEVAELMGCSGFKAQCLEFMRANLSEVQATESYALLVERRPALLKDLIEVLLPPSKRQRCRGSSSSA